MFDRIKHRFVYVSALTLLGLSACARVSSSESASNNGHSSTVTVKRGTLRRTVRLNGTVGAVESFSVLAPRLTGQMISSGTMVLTKIVRNGTTIRKGDVLVEIDRQSQMKNIQDRQAEYDGFLQQIRRKQADQISTRISDETEMKGSEVDVRTALVEMRKNELIPRYQAEINKANLAEAEAQLKQLKETFKLKREAEAADIRILEIQRDRALRALEYAKSNVNKMTIVSPMNGLVVLTPIYKGTRLVDPQEGDEVRAGAAIMLVVNPSAMQVMSRVNQVDLANVRAGLPAEVRLDAYPDLVFPGRVERISAMVIPGGSRRIRNFSAMVSIQGRNPKLLPDLTASADVLLQTLENVLILPRQAITTYGGNPAVEVFSKGKRELRPVKTGAMSDCEIVIESGLQEGMQVILPDDQARQPGKAEGAGSE